MKGKGTTAVSRLETLTNLPGGLVSELAPTVGTLMERFPGISRRFPGSSESWLFNRICSGRECTVQMDVAITSLLVASSQKTSHLHIFNVQPYPLRKRNKACMSLVPTR